MWVDRSVQPDRNQAAKKQLNLNFLTAHTPGNPPGNCKCLSILVLLPEAGLCEEDTEKLSLIVRANVQTTVELEMEVSTTCVCVR